MVRPIPLHTLTGVPDAEVTTHPFTTDDGLGLSMLRFRGSRKSTGDDIVLVIHGLTTSSDMFIMPEHRNLVRFLLDNGFGDVWTLDYRMSNRHPYNRAMHRFTMDDIALNDFPAAIAELRRSVGNRRVHVIAHCLGSVSFLMSLFGGALDAVGGVSSVIANSTGLTPRVPAWSRLKLNVAPGVMEYLLGFPYLDPRWHAEPRFTRGWLFSKVVDLFHPECDNPACHLLSLMWGTGWPALYSHDKLHEVTHARGGDLYGATGFHYYRHVLAMVDAGRAVKFAKGAAYDSLPDDYLAGAAEVTTPVLLTTGETNRVFADSNIVCYERLEAVAPGRHELEVFPGYGHQDVFMGKNVDIDVFPRMLDFLKRQAA
ncbi:alpha/beta hydrolase [Prauserella marina]|uniref:Cholesterol oxidase n=1 Tax=Prauserella marina TaxID=530584 RepID=A0A222VYF9_9PSEU|nr:alpha/beta fold hydrolase [Prauserella marina]ASR38967.1 alpha/beta hydrolase [Prauserella marina]PWV70996.1 alpha/beta hydrolase family protein [Prauserella marina]SDD99934.1 cholesterol oxidase [Prauserella marina]